MPKHELEAILLTMLLDAYAARAKTTNPLAGAVADIALVKRTAQTIIDTANANTMAMLDEIEQDLALVAQTHNPNAVKA